MIKETWRELLWRIAHWSTIGGSWYRVSLAGQRLSEMGRSHDLFKLRSVVTGTSMIREPLAVSFARHCNKTWPLWKPQTSKGSLHESSSVPRCQVCTQWWRSTHWSLTVIMVIADTDEKGTAFFVSTEPLNSANVFLSSNFLGGHGDGKRALGPRYVSYDCEPSFGNVGPLSPPVDQLPASNNPDALSSCNVRCCF